MGVVGISNEITLRARAQVADLSRRIEEALTCQAIREAKQIHIAVEGDTVRLTGTVHSWHEREAAQGVAWWHPACASWSTSCTWLEYRPAASGPHPSGDVHARPEPLRA